MVPYVGKKRNSCLDMNYCDAVTFRAFFSQYGLSHAQHTDVSADRYQRKIFRMAKKTPLFTGNLLIILLRSKASWVPLCPRSLWTWMNTSSWTYRKNDYSWTDCRNHRNGLKCNIFSEYEEFLNPSQPQKSSFDRWHSSHDQANKKCLSCYQDILSPKWRENSFEVWLCTGFSKKILVIKRPGGT